MHTGRVTLTKGGIYVSERADKDPNQAEETDKSKDERNKVKKLCIMLKKGVNYKGEVLKKKEHGLGVRKEVGKSYFRGGFYKGEYEGPGLIVEADGSQYLGDFLQGDKHGFGTTVKTLKPLSLVAESGAFPGSRVQKDQGSYKNGELEGFCMREGFGRFSLPQSKSSSQDSYSFIGFCSRSLPTAFGKEESAGEKYHGQFSVGFRHGIGLKKLQSGGYYLGNWFRGERNGFGEMVSEKGAKYKGWFRAGVLEGIASVSYKDKVEAESNGSQESSKYIGCFCKGTRQGFGKMEKAEVVYIGNWNNDKHNGVGYQSKLSPNNSSVSIRSTKNTESYFGDWQMDKRHGIGIQKTPEYIYLGQWRENLPEGVGFIEYLSESQKNDFFDPGSTETFAIFKRGNISEYCQDIQYEESCRQKFEEKVGQKTFERFIKLGDEKLNQYQVEIDREMTKTMEVFKEFDFNFKKEEAILRKGIEMINLDYKTIDKKIEELQLKIDSEVSPGVFSEPFKISSQVEIPDEYCFLQKDQTIKDSSIQKKFALAEEPVLNNDTLLSLGIINEEPIDNNKENNEAQLISLKSANENLIKKLTNLQNKLDESEKEIRKGAQIKQILEEDLETLRRTNANLTAAKQDDQKSQEKLISNLKNDLKLKVSENNSLNERLNSSERQNNSLNSTLQQKKTELAGVEEKLQEALKTSTEQQTKQKREISDLQKEVESKSQTLSSLNSNLQTKETAVSRLESQLARAKQELEEEKKDRLKSSTQESAEFRTKLEAKDHQLESTKKSLEANLQKIANLERAQKETSFNLTKSQEEFEEKEKLLKEAKKEKEAILKQNEAEKEKLVKDAREDKERMLKEAQADKEKLLRQALEEKEKLLKQTDEEKLKGLKQNSDEKDLLLKQKEEEKEKLVKEAAEEREKILKQAQEERLKLLKEASDDKEKLLKENEEAKQKMQKEFAEEKEKLLREASEQKEKLQKEALEEKEKILSDSSVEKEKLLKQNEEEKQKLLKEASEQKDKLLKQDSDKKETQEKNITEEKERLLKEGKEEKEKLLKEASEEKAKILKQTEEEKENLLKEAREEKEKLLKEARDEKEKILKEATEEKEKLLKEASEEKDKLQKESTEAKPPPPKEEVKKEPESPPLVLTESTIKDFSYTPPQKPQQDQEKPAKPEETKEKITIEESPLKTLYEFKPETKENPKPPELSVVPLKELFKLEAVEKAKSDSFNSLADGNNNKSDDFLSNDGDKDDNPPNTGNVLEDNQMDFLGTYLESLNTGQPEINENEEDKLLNLDFLSKVVDLVQDKVPEEGVEKYADHTEDVQKLKTELQEANQEIEKLRKELEDLKALKESEESKQPQVQKEKETPLEEPKKEPESKKEPETKKEPEAKKPEEDPKRKEVDEKAKTLEEQVIKALPTLTDPVIVTKPKGRKLWLMDINSCADAIILAGDTIVSYQILENGELNLFKEIKASGWSSLDVLSKNQVLVISEGSNDLTLYSEDLSLLLEKKSEANRGTKMAPFNYTGDRYFKLWNKNKSVVSRIDSVSTSFQDIQGMWLQKGSQRSLKPLFACHDFSNRYYWGLALDTVNEKYISVYLDSQDPSQIRQSTLEELSTLFDSVECFEVDLNRERIFLVGSKSNFAMFASVRINSSDFSVEYSKKFFDKQGLKSFLKVKRLEGTNLLFIVSRTHLFICKYDTEKKELEILKERSSICLGGIKDLCVAGSNLFLLDEGTCELVSMKLSGLAPYDQFYQAEYCKQKDADMSKALVNLAKREQAKPRHSLQMMKPQHGCKIS